MTSFVAYIDESGDEGFRFLPREQGSSRWLVLSAVVFRKKNDTQAVRMLEAVREQLGKPPKKALHFRGLKHEQRVPFIRAISAAKIRVVSILIYKPGIKNPEHYQRDSHKLYRYATRLLLERVSWLCATSRIADDGDGTADLVFSNRSAMSYEQLKEYLGLLQYGAPAATCHIDWSAFDYKKVRAVNHDQLAGLQIADAVASGTYYALNLNQYGESEPRYFEMLNPLFYRNKASIQGYGLKFWPNFADLRKTLDHLAAIERFV